MGGVDYSRWRFTDNLPEECLYTASHCWLREAGTGEWHVGMTRFALWLVGDVVEYGFTIAPGTAVAAGQKIGWVEGLKAVHALETPVAGLFLAQGSAIAADITMLKREPYQSGWLYAVRGTPSADAFDLRRYTALLDACVDAVKIAREAECGGDCEC